MATLRQAINARISVLTARIETIKKKAANMIAPLQAQLYAEQKKFAQFAPMLDTEVAEAKARLRASIDESAR